MEFSCGIVFHFIYSHSFTHGKLNISVCVYLTYPGFKFFFVLVHKISYVMVLQVLPYLIEVDFQLYSAHIHRPQFTIQPELN